MSRHQARDSLHAIRIPVALPRATHAHVARLLHPLSACMFPLPTRRRMRQDIRCTSEVSTDATTDVTRIHVDVLEVDSEHASDDRESRYDGGLLCRLFRSTQVVSGYILHITDAATESVTHAHLLIACLHARPHV